MEPLVSFDCWLNPGTDEDLCDDGTSAVTIASSSHDHGTSQQPVSDATKKQRRQWDAWTHQEEESFFTALRQVGKNFKKIYHIVQSKNKDQVRHYYYRFLRHMNKVFRPGLCFSAKNSKVTNAAMFHWWTLPEKHNFKDAKLHLRPRKLKIFLNDLKHRFLMDRIENIKKRHALREVCSTAATEIAFSQGKALVNDRQAVKVVLPNSQHIQELGSGKGSLLKCNTYTGVNCSNCKGDTTFIAAYKTMKEAAIAGVSLVADAAEHLERTALDETNEPGKGENCVVPTGSVVPSSATSLQNLCVDNSSQLSSKLKLQLFPIDEITRRALEMDDHNPHLELTLSTRKKISSVLEHLNRKWGKSNMACGELLLLPYRVQKENLINCQRWTQDSALSVADVFKQIGSPSIFRLRCIFTKTELQFSHPETNGKDWLYSDSGLRSPGVWADGLTSISIGLQRDITQGLLIIYWSVLACHAADLMLSDGMNELNHLMANSQQSGCISKLLVLWHGQKGISSSC